MIYDDGFCYILFIFFLGLGVSPEEGTVVLNLNIFLTVRKVFVNIADFTHVTVGQNFMRFDYIAAQPFA
jgi:hypothetical protein